MYKSSFLIFVGVLVTTGFIRPQVNPQYNNQSILKNTDSPVIAPSPTLDTFKKNKENLSKELQIGKQYSKSIGEQQKAILSQTDTMKKLAELNSSKRAKILKDTAYIRINNKGFFYRIFHKKQK